MFSRGFGSAGFVRGEPETSTIAQTLDADRGDIITSVEERAKCAQVVQESTPSPHSLGFVQFGDAIMSSVTRFALRDVLCQNFCERCMIKVSLELVNALGDDICAASLHIDQGGLQWWKWK